MKTAIFLSARNKATRLPNKHLLEINGRSTIEHLIDRLKLSQEADIIVLCTSFHKDDQILVDIAKRNNIKSFCGSENDKLERYLDAARKLKVDFMVIVDADDIFCDPEYIDMIIKRYKETLADFISCEDLPFGIASHGIKTTALEKICSSKSESDTEVWGDYFFKNDSFKKEVIKAKPEHIHYELRASLDYQEDLDFFQKIFDELGNKNTFSLKQIVDLVKAKPEIIKINLRKHKDYLQHLQKKRDLVLRDIK